MVSTWILFVYDRTFRAGRWWLWYARDGERKRTSPPGLTNEKRKKIVRNCIGVHEFACGRTVRTHCFRTTSPDLAIRSSG
jgi:hypothetical protein